jgi:hypothetical protein
VHRCRDYLQLIKLCRTTLTAVYSTDGGCCHVDATVNLHIAGPAVFKHRRTLTLTHVNTHMAVLLADQLALAVVEAFNLSLLLATCCEHRARQLVAASSITLQINDLKHDDPCFSTLLTLDTTCASAAVCHLQGQWGGNSYACEFWHVCWRSSSCVHQHLLHTWVVQQCRQLVWGQYRFKHSQDSNKTCAPACRL